MRSHLSPPSFAAIIAAIALLAATITTSHAVVVALDFEEPTVPAPDTQIGIPEYTEDGFHIKPLGPVDTVSPFRLRRNGGSIGGLLAGSPQNGTPYLQLATGDSFEMTQLSSAAFAPISVDLAEFSELFSTIPISVTFTGFFADTSSVSTTFVTDGIIDGTGALFDFQTFLFPGTFTGIVRMEAAEVSDPLFSFSLDRLFVNTIPEPSRTVLCLLAITAMILPRRRAPKPLAT